MAARKRETIAILVVDDVNEMREMLLRLLRVMGFGPLVSVKNGEEAIELLRQQPFDLVLCDWNMPGVAGIDVLNTLRTLPQGDVPFIMVTGESHREKIKAAIDAGVTDYLLKPFNAVTLEAKITSACGPNR